MRKILILMGRYLPGHKDGGPLRTMINVTEALGDEYEFYIACLDRDNGDTQPYSNIAYNAWNIVGKAKVWYVRPGEFSFGLIKNLAKMVDLIYTCSFYDDYGYKLLLLNKFGKLFGKPVVVASMGVFSKGALTQKAIKKKIYIKILSTIGLFKNIKWSVTSALEMADVKKVIGNKADCIIAEDLPRTTVPGRACDKTPQSRLKVVFLSRISPIKNLYAAVLCLKKIRSEIEFTIYGPIEDYNYWEKCHGELEKLPSNVLWKYEGDVPSELVQDKLQEHDVFLFPTLGENYGHVIFETLSVGCIPIISDQTPWTFIADKNAGFVFKLTDDMAEFTDTIDKLADMSSEQRRKIANNAVEVAREKINRSIENTGYRSIFG